MALLSLHVHAPCCITWCSWRCRCCSCLLDTELWGSQCYMYRLLLEYAALFGNASVPEPEPLKELRQLGLHGG